ncbi:MAG: hypothetical protein KF809_11825 [Chloroflexi bacterium]|nr:hypothetical protein [Chloroflexota bacterium]
MVLGRRAVLLIVALLLAVVPVPALADDDNVTERATVTYRLDRAGQAIDVTAAISYTNRIPTVGRTRFYLERWGTLWVPSGVRGFKVKGRGVRAQKVAEQAGYRAYIVTFPRIYHGGTVRFTATWTLPSRGSGSDQTTRVGAAYSHVCWIGQPVDSGSVTLVVPRGLDAVTRGSDVRVRQSGRTQRIEAVRRSDLAGFQACTDIYDEDRLLRREIVSPGGQPIVLQAWPEDAGWLDDASSAVTGVVEALEQVVGVPLPSGDPIRVREVSANALLGYGGEYDPRHRIVRLSERETDPHLLSHELAHAWFNARTVNDEWLWEGLAEWTARTSRESRCDPPGDPPVGSPRLRDWRYLAFQTDFALQSLVQWQYAAACAIQGRIADAVGPERMRLVLRTILGGASPYDLLPPLVPVEAPVEVVQQDTLVMPVASPVSSLTRSSKRRTKPVDWRQWLDIVDEVGLVRAGVTDLTVAEDVLVEMGVVRRRQLADRADARTAFRTLQATTPAGITPVVVRRALDDWRFPDARRAMRTATQIAGLLADRAAAGTGVRDDWLAFERASTLKALQRLRDRLRE